MNNHEDCIQVYGFGSFFGESHNYGDIDLLLVHDNLTPSSCQNAITCKNEIIKLTPNAHITLLSKQEEKSISFISRSKSTLLGSIYPSSRHLDIEKISKGLILLSNKKARQPAAEQPSAPKK